MVFSRSFRQIDHGAMRVPTVTKSLGEGTQSVILTLSILERLASKRGPVGITELARDIGTSKSRIFRHLQTLVSCRYVSANGTTGEYEVGPQLVAFGREVSERYDLVSLAEPVMSKLRDLLGHTVIISRVDGTGVQVLRSMPGNSAIVVGVRPGTTLPFTLSAQGLIALAFGGSSRRMGETTFSEAFRSFSGEHPDELERIRKQGWARAEMREGLRGFAAPVLDTSGNLVATLALLDTALDIGDDESGAKTGALVDAASKLSRQIAT
jgi:IclR family KDG regulon transcriptional repressor